MHTVKRYKLVYKYVEDPVMGRVKRPTIFDQVKSRGASGNIDKTGRYVIIRTEETEHVKLKRDGFIEEKE